MEAHIEDELWHEGNGDQENVATCLIRCRIINNSMFY